MDLWQASTGPVANVTGATFIGAALTSKKMGLLP